MGSEAALRVELPLYNKDGAGRHDSAASMKTNWDHLDPRTSDPVVESDGQCENSTTETFGETMMLPYGSSSLIFIVDGAKAVVPFHVFKELLEHGWRPDNKTLGVPILADVGVGQTEGRHNLRDCFRRCRNIKESTCFGTMRIQARPYSSKLRSKSTITVASEPFFLSVSTGEDWSDSSLWSLPTAESLTFVRHNTSLC